MGIIELLKKIGNKIKIVATVTFSNQDFVGEDAIENLELAILTTSEVDNRDGSELIKVLRDVEKRNKGIKKDSEQRKTLFGKRRANGGKGKGGKAVSRVNMQDATIKSIKDGVKTTGQYKKDAVQVKEVKSDEHAHTEYEGH